MKHRLMCLVAPLVLLSAPMAFAQARFQQVHEISVKPGQELVWENYIKKLAAGADKIGSKNYWTAYAVSIGKPGGTYRVALSFNSWAEREAWGTVPTIMVKAYGQQEAERRMKEGGNTTERTVVEVWEHLPGSSANQTTPPAPAGNFARAQIVRVAPGMAADYVAMTVKFKPAYEAAAGKPLVTRWVLAITRIEAPGVFYAGDFINGPTTVVEAVASGKNAALEIESYLSRGTLIRTEKSTKSYYAMPGYRPLPVSLEADFFGRPIHSPYLLSASPLTDGLAQINKAYEHGWPGAVMKTAFDNVPIHIPSEYMFTFSPSTYANADNVSGHPLDRVCREIEILVKNWPDRLTLASTGGPVTGRDESDRAGWQSNTRKLEASGAMVIEYSLSCPQGGAGWTCGVR